MTSYIEKISILMSAQEKRRAMLLLVMILIMAAVNMAGVASIMPFIALVSDPQIIERHEMLMAAYEFIDPKGINEFMMIVGCGVFVIFFLSLGSKALTDFFMIRFALMLEYSLSRRLMVGYLDQKYAWFLNRSGADLGKAILAEVSNVTGSAVVPLLTLVANGVLAVAMIVIVIAIDPMVALIATVALAGSYFIVFWCFRDYMVDIGKRRGVANLRRFEVTGEAFAAIKEIKLGNLESIYVDQFDLPALEYATSRAKAQAVGTLPRYLLEAIAFGGLLTAMILIIAEGGDIKAVIPVITVYAFAGYRLLPALQQVYGSLSKLKFFGPALDELYKDLSNLHPRDAQHEIPCMPALTGSIAMQDVSYTYPTGHYPIVQKMNIKIDAGSTVGLVGPTGGGKTTVVDIILGLLNPDQGAVIVDGKKITELNQASWQAKIGYVAQQIYLSDASIAQNIAFGVVPEKIDYDRVEAAAKTAQLDKFVTKNLPEGFKTKIGERGVRLSGGQRQRIGIARALYRNPDVLILDEATAALDNETESALMQAINQLDSHVTVIMIAHRLSTVTQCDNIFVVDGGKIEASGTYDRLLKTSRIFKKMVSGSAD